MPLGSSAVCTTCLIPSCPGCGSGGMNFEEVKIPLANLTHYVGDSCPGGHQEIEQKEGFKFDQGKLRFDLIPPHALSQLAEVYTHGAKKYSDVNYLKGGGMSYRRILAALMRHVEAFRAGETDDPDSGLPHMAHAAWQCFTLMTYEVFLDNPKDDRDMMKEALRVEDEDSITEG